MLFIMLAGHSPFDAPEARSNLHTDRIVFEHDGR